MPDSRPPIFDDGGELPDVDRSRAPDRPSNDDHRPAGRHPNYLVRRAIVIGLAVALLAGGSVAVSRVLSDDGDGNSSTLGNPQWNTIVGIDDITGSVVLSDAQGVETDRFRIGVQPLTASRLVGTTLVATTAAELAVVNLKDTEAITIVDLESDGTLTMPSGSAQTLIAHDAAANRSVFVNGSTGELIDTDSFAAIAGARYDLELARSDPAGRNILVTDTGNFQSVLFSFERDAPSFFPGLALAVDDSLVVTAQNVGNDATITVFDHEGEPGISARTSSVRAGMLVDGAVVLVTVEGDVVLLSVADGSVESVTSLTVGTVLAGHVAVRGDRLIVIGEDGTAVLSSDGTVIADLPGATPTTTGIDEGAPRDGSCLIVQRSAVGEVAVIDLEDGTVRAEALADADVLAPVSGCDPVARTPSGYLVITQEGVLRATTVGVVAGLSPDGQSLVIENANRLELLPRITKDSETTDVEPIDIGRSGRHVLFAEL